MKELLRVFNYLQKYHEDNFDVLYLVLEFLFFVKNQEWCAALLAQKDKEKALEDFKHYLKSLGIEAVGFHVDLNYSKVLRELKGVQVQAHTLWEFIQAVTMQKTILKLYEFATPTEINALVGGILNVKSGESIYNPCCGLGSWLLHLEHSRDCYFYGIDINPKSIRIARALALLLDFRACVFDVGDIFSEPFVAPSQFDKVFCHPPLLTHFNIKAPKESSLTPYNKTALEIPFIDYSLMRFKKKAVFIVRTALLNKGAGERLYEYLLEQGLLECVIDLPDNILPYKAESYSLLVISHQNRRCLFIDARNFYLKNGKYNKLINLEEILDLYFSKQNTKHSNFMDYPSIMAMKFQKTPSSMQASLDSFLESVYRGARIASKSDSDLISCYDFGIKDFNCYGFSNNFCDSTLKVNSKQLDKLKIKPFDLLLSMRGVIPKLAIIGEAAEGKIVLPNAGILVLRFRDYTFSRALYCYFLSKDGQEMLKNFYCSYNERVGEKEIRALELPKNFLQSLEEYNRMFREICTYGELITKYTEDIKKILGF